MITPELTAYLRSELQAGRTQEVITQTLLGQGWQAADIAEGFASVQAAQAATPAMLAAAPAKKAPIAAIVIISLVVVLAALAALAYFFLPNGLSRNAAASPTPSPTASATPAVSTLSNETYTSTALSFKYDATWQKRTLLALMESPGAGTDADPVLFFTPAHLAEATADIAAAKASTDSSAAFSLLFTLPLQSEAAITRTPGVTAQALARTYTQNTCAADGSLNFSSESPVDPSRITTATIAGKSGYLVTSQAICTMKSYNLIFDLDATNSVVIGFNCVDSLSSFSAGQRAMYDSISFAN